MLKPEVLDGNSNNGVSIIDCFEKILRSEESEMVELFLDNKKKIKVFLEAVEVERINDVVGNGVDLSWPHLREIEKMRRKMEKLSEKWRQDKAQLRLFPLEEVLLKE